MKNGYVIYEGPSMIDGGPIVAIATGFVNKSRNIKTGRIVQTFIMRSDKEPIPAADEGLDYSVCGDCPHRPVNMHSCYVQLIWSPTMVWRSWKRGIYDYAPPDELTELAKGASVRLGSYGDPTAIPYGIVESFVREAIMRVGYTHQWRTCDQRFKFLCMASVDNISEVSLARDMGWRYFRVTESLETKLKNEVVCPASAERNHSTTCEKCKACGGADGRHSNIVIKVHGSRKGLFASPEGNGTSVRAFQDMSELVGSGEK